VRTTTYYGLPYHELDDTTNPDSERERFEIIDSQLHGLFSVFGNGIVSGWGLTSGGALNLTVGIGEGYLRWTYASTNAPTSLDNLPSNSTIYVYAGYQDITPSTATPRFIWSVTPIASDDTSLLGVVITGTQSITSIDTSTKHNVGFLESILDRIAEHHHSGGENEPDRINLATEVRGVLPGYRVGDLNAGQVTSGRFDAARIPRLAHGDLRDVGVLTHAQLDAFTQSLQNPNTMLLGEVATSNLLQHVLSMKHTIADFDDYFFNEIAIIPGISPDSYTDSEATTAIVDKVNHEIRGIIAQTGTLAFFNASGGTVFSKSNRTNADVDLLSGEVTLARPQVELIIENFSKVKVDGGNVPGWTKEIKSISSSKFVGDSSRKYEDNQFAGDIHLLDNTHSITFTKPMSGVNLTGYTKLYVAVRSASTAHPPVFMDLVDASETTTFILVEDGEVTDDYVVKTYEIGSIPRTSVTSLVIRTDTDSGWNPMIPVDVFVGDIRTADDLLYEQQGSVFLKFHTPQPSQWRTISWTADTPSGTSIRVRARVGNLESELTFAPWSTFIYRQGDVLPVDDSAWIELETQLLSNPQRSATPILRSVKAGYATPSESDSFEIASQEAWNRGMRLTNIDTVTYSGEIRVSSPIRVGDMTYLSGNLLQQVGPDLVGFSGTTGNRLPLSPKQVAGIWKSVPGFVFPTDAVRLTDRTYMVCDTLNDRIVIVDADGDPVTIYAANWVPDFALNSFFPLVPNYDRAKKLLSIPLSLKVTETGIDTTKMLFRTRTNEVRLLSVDVVVNQYFGEFKGGSVVSVMLSDETANKLDSLLTGDVYLDFDDGAFPGKLDASPVGTSLGVLLLVGEVKWVEWLRSPISASLRADGKLLVCNGKTPSAPETDIASLICVNLSTLKVTTSTNDPVFSYLTSGSAIEMASGDILVACMEKRTLTDAPTSITGLDAKIPKDITSVMTDYIGKVIVMRSDGFRRVFEYESSQGLYPADAREYGDGTYLVSERSIMTKNAGRIIRIDEGGNILSQFGLGSITAPDDSRMLNNGSYLVSV
jgi:hypothetical protein